MEGRRERCITGCNRVFDRFMPPGCCASAHIDVKDAVIRFSAAKLQPATHTHAAWTSERHLQRADRDDASWAHQDRNPPLQRGWSRLPRAHASTRSAMVAIVAARASPARCAGAMGAGAGTARRPRARTSLQGSGAPSPVPYGRSWSRPVCVRDLTYGTAVTWNVWHR